MAHRPQRRMPLLAGAVGCGLVLVVGLLLGFSQARAYDEEPLYFYEPWTASNQVYSGTEVSSVHFDLVGALALAAGFSISDAGTIQLYSQLTDSGIITGSQVYSLAERVTFPAAPAIGEVVTSTICPAPATTGAEVTMGSTDLVECPGCFTSRFGPLGVFFHFPHDRPEELGAIHDWAYGDSEGLQASATFGYSSTARFDWMGIANVYATTPCFVTQTVTVDTGDIQAGSLAAFGIYLHSLGDYWSHLDCIAAADAAGEPFAAHVLVPPGDSLAACRWTMHEVEFGDSGLFPDSNRTFSGTLAIYQALVDFAAHSDRPLYRPIPLTADKSFLYNTLYVFVHVATHANPQPRRNLANLMRQWSLQTRVRGPEYWLQRIYLPWAGK